VIWFEKEKILYGGCLIKGAEAKDLGYLGDANVNEYANTLRNVQLKCPDPKHIIVSHHDWEDVNCLKHSIRLAEEMREKRP
jgi:metallo-beta-lactamase class B